MDDTFGSHLALSLFLPVLSLFPGLPPPFALLQARPQRGVFVFQRSHGRAHLPGASSWPGQAQLSQAVLAEDC